MTHQPHLLSKCVANNQDKMLISGKSVITDVVVPPPKEQIPKGSGKLGK